MSNAAQPPDRATTKRALQRMNNEAFEHFVAELWERQGWTCEVSQKSRDKSLDVLAERDSPYHMRHAIQAKRYQQGNNVGGPTVSEIASLTDYFDADSALVVTTSDFTRDARERAEQLHQVKLIDGDDLVDMVVDMEAYDLVEQYGERIRSGREAETKPQVAIEKQTAAVSQTTAIQSDRLVDGIINTLGGYPLVVGIGTVWLFGGLILRAGWIGGPIGGIFALGLLFGPIMSFGGVYADTTRIRANEHIDWNPNPVGYLGGMLLALPVAVIIWYGIRQKKLNNG
jgi:hypothetical protein